jgi:hypothetical protein
LYKKEEQRSIIKRYIELLIELAGAGNHYNKNEEAVKEFQEYRFYLLCVLFNMKDSYHDIEQEYRICIIPDANYKKIMFKNKEGILVPYISMNFERKNISSVVIGPMIKDEIAEYGIIQIRERYDLVYTIEKSTIIKRY